MLTSPFNGWSPPPFKPANFTGHQLSYGRIALEIAPPTQFSAANPNWLAPPEVGVLTSVIYGCVYLIFKLHRLFDLNE